MHSISRRGADRLKAEVVKTPRRESQQAPSSSRIKQSSSPIKCLKLDGFNNKVFLGGLEGPEGYAD